MEEENPKRIKLSKQEQERIAKELRRDRALAIRRERQLRREELLSDHIRETFEKDLKKIDFLLDTLSTQPSIFLLREVNRLYDLYGFVVADVVEEEELPRSVARNLLDEFNEPDSFLLPREQESHANHSNHSNHSNHVNPMNHQDFNYPGDRVVDGSKN